MKKKIFAFSLVEMLMALLVASLLLVALAPVITKKYNETVSIKGLGDRMQEMTYTLSYNDEYCSTLDDTNGVCTGEFPIPSNVAGSMYVTVIGAGGGGAAAASTGSVEYKTEGEHNFIVPQGVDEITVTLVSGGQGGYAGTGTEANKTFTTPGVFDWSSSDSTNPMPAVLKGRYVKLTGCGGGGGGGGGGIGDGKGGGGGSGEYRITPIASLVDKNATKIRYQVGGGGGGGGNNYLGAGGAGACGGGGTGGSDDEVRVYTESTCPAEFRWGGKGGILLSYSPFNYQAAGGGYPSGVDGSYKAFVFTTQATAALGGTGVNGGSGGNSGNATAVTSGDTNVISGGGGGGEFGGGGGGAGCTGSGAGGGGPTYFNGTLIAAGGGGGGGVAHSSSNTSKWACAGGGGGGGGGNGGGNGGVGADVQNHNNIAYSGGGGYGGNLNGKNGDSNGNCGNNTTATYNGTTTFGNNYCRGGYGALSSSWSSSIGETGKSGLIYLRYLNYSAGGKGGGTGKTVTRTISVVPGETLKISLGSGGTGGEPAYINSSAETISAVAPTAGSATTVERKVDDTTYTVLATSGTSNTTDGSAANGLNGGNGAKINGMGCTVGSGGNTDIRNEEIEASNTINAKNYGGCGGGGGYALSRGGNGSFGYAKITWNAAKKGTGGGGASGYYIEKRMIQITPGSSIPFQIGKGGEGGKIEDGEVVMAQKGGDTIFGTGSTPDTNFKVTAGGGYGGMFPMLNAANTFENGKGGFMANLCRVGTKDLLLCSESFAGNDGTDTKGGAGANSKYGEGGAGGAYNANGKAPEEDAFGAGGGGAGVFNAGTVSEGGEGKNDSEGAKGADGQIILLWYMK